MKYTILSSDRTRFTEYGDLTGLIFEAENHIQDLYFGYVQIKDRKVWRSIFRKDLKPC